MLNSAIFLSGGGHYFVPGDNLHFWTITKCKILNLPLRHFGAPDSGVLPDHPSEFINVWQGNRVRYRLFITKSCWFLGFSSWTIICRKMAYFNFILMTKFRNPWYQQLSAISYWYIIIGALRGRAVINTTIF